MIYHKIWIRMKQITKKMPKTNQKYIKESHNLYDSRKVKTHPVETLSIYLHSEKLHHHLDHAFVSSF